MSQSGEDYDVIEWSNFTDVVLLNSLAGLRPVGINYPFCMMAVWNRFSSTLGKNVSMECVENRLATFYDFEAANGIVDDNFIFSQDQDFSLPESDFPEVAAILKEKESTLSRKTSKGGYSETSKTPTSKGTKKTEPKTAEKTKRNEDDRKTPAKKRGRGNEKASTPAAKRSRN